MNAAAPKQKAREVEPGNTDVELDARVGKSPVTPGTVLPVSALNRMAREAIERALPLMWVGGLLLALGGGIGAAARALKAWLVPAHTEMLDELAKVAERALQGEEPSLASASNR